MSEIRAVVGVASAVGERVEGAAVDGVDVRVRRALERHGGVVEASEGTVLLATFSGATSAVAAAVTAQQTVAGVIGIGIDIEELGTMPVAATPVAARVARLARRAQPAAVLVTGAVHGLVRTEAGVEIVPSDRADETDSDEIGLLYEVRWERTLRLPRVVVADDAALIRSGVVQLLDASGFEVVGEAGDFDALIATVERAVPDLVVTDIRMPPSNSDEGLRAAAEIRERHPDVAVLVLSQYIEARAAADLLDGRPAGIGYVLKERVSNLDEFVEACHQVVGGGSVIDPLVAERLVAVGGREDALARLTDRERDVLDLMAEGSSNAAIAARLHVGHKTVETHIRSIFMKLDLEETPEGHRRVQAVLRWLQGEGRRG